MRTLRFRSWFRLPCARRNKDHCRKAISDSGCAFGLYQYEVGVHREATLQMMEHESGDEELRADTRHLGGVGEGLLQEQLKR